MTLLQRREACQRLIESYKAELVGIESVINCWADSSQAFVKEHERVAYQRARLEAMDILQKGEGR